MKIAIVHYWWLSNRGGEAVVKAIADIYPSADIFLHVCDESLVKKTLGPSFKGCIYNTFISRLPKASKYYQKYLPLMPLALEQLDLTSYDLVISSESGPAKGVITRPDALHICYCHSPMRYIWDMYHEYLGNASALVRYLFPVVSHWLRMWDRLSSDRVDFFIANSTFIASRIKKYYRRESKVIFPPVNTSVFDCTRDRGDYYLCLGQLVSYKRIDIAVDAFNYSGKKLVIIGEGEMLCELKSKAKNNIIFLGRQNFAIVKSHLETCKALIFPGVEDFGIVPVEAMSAGAPVIAYGRGGVLDTVVDGETGVLFNDQTASSLINAVESFESNLDSFKSNILRRHAEKFDKLLFEKKFTEFVSSCKFGNEWF